MCWVVKVELSLKYPQDIEIKFEFQTFSLKCIYHRNINYCVPEERSGWIKICFRQIIGYQYTAICPLNDWWWNLVSPQGPRVQEIKHAAEISQGPNWLQVQLRAIRSHPKYFMLFPLDRQNVCAFSPRWILDILNRLMRQPVHTSFTGVHNINVKCLK